MLYLTLLLAYLLSSYPWPGTSGSGSTGSGCAGVCPPGTPCYPCRCFQLTPEKMKYDDARRYCRNMNTDVATVYNLAEVNIMLSLVLSTGSNIWIGLELGNLWIWHWTGSDQGTSFLNWDIGEPHNNKQEACAVMNQNGMWLENDCGTLESFVCQGR
uniref:C-type lectin domain-containing protein n=1 Tax=Poecilia reticulata TaxID=8081 RepID=A0A3P9N1V4_POERE